MDNITLPIRVPFSADEISEAAKTFDVTVDMLTGHSMELPQKIQCAFCGCMLDGEQFGEEEDMPDANSQT